MSAPNKTPKLSNQQQHYGRLGHDVQRPRRPDPDDVIYLEGVPLQAEGDEQRLAARAGETRYLLRRYLLRRCLLRRCLLRRCLPLATCHLLLAAY